MRKRLVVAHYKEDLNWLNRINQDVVKFIYHKDTNLTDYREKLQVTENEFQLCNVGRESHTYLYHIIENFDKLSNIMVFFPGSLNLLHKKIKAKIVLNNIIKMISECINIQYISVLFKFDKKGAEQAYKTIINNFTPDLGDLLTETYGYIHHIRNNFNKGSHKN